MLEAGLLFGAIPRSGGRYNNDTPSATISGGSLILPVYDAAGNMTEGPSAPRPADWTTAEQTKHKYVYDAWNRLVQVTDDEDVVIATYRYDGLGRRIQKLLGPDPEEPTATYDYFYNESWQVVEVRLDGAPDPLDQYVWDVRYIDAPVVRFHDSDTDGNYLDAEDNILYYTTDANFNVTALVDAETGEVVERYMYDPYGKATVCEEDWTPREDNASAVANDVLYCGYRFDAETGLYNVRFRMHHPTLGRWLQRDPAGYVDGMNTYQFALANPLTRRDPTGLITMSYQCGCVQPQFSSRGVNVYYMIIGGKCTCTSADLPPGVVFLGMFSAVRASCTATCWYLLRKHMAGLPVTRADRDTAMQARVQASMRGYAGFLKNAPCIDCACGP